MAEKLVPGDLFFRKARESVSSLDSDKLAPASAEGAGEESSDSEGEQEGSSHKLIRKVSTSGQMRSKVREPGPTDRGCVSVLWWGNDQDVCGETSGWREPPWPGREVKARFISSSAGGCRGSSPSVSTAA